MKQLSLFCIGLIVLIAAGCSNQKAVVPTTFSKFISTDQAFTCDQPNGWKVDKFAANGVESGVTFSSNDSKIEIDSDQAGAFMSDALSSPTTAGLLGAQGVSGVSPVDKLHAMYGRKFTQNVDGYSELSTSPMKVPFGQTRVTEFTGNGVHGYRVTILGNNRSVTVNCHCSPSDWPALSPSFLRIIQSITPGTGT